MVRRRRRSGRFLVLFGVSTAILQLLSAAPPSTLRSALRSALPSARLVGFDSICAPTRHAVAYYGNGALVVPQPSSYPYPCTGTTGYGGAETRVVVTSDGTVVYEPAILNPGIAGTGYLAGAPGPHPSTQLSSGGLAMSNDLGTTWRLVEPAGQTWVPQDDQLYADRSSGWLYYYALSPDPVPQSGTPLQDQLPAGYAQLMASPDDGRTWYHTALPGFVESENPRFASAPAPTGQPAPTPYASQADVVYWCGNNTLFVERYRACYRSLNGGVSWSYASVLFSTPVPQHSQCGTNGESFSAGDGNYPQGAPDGSLFVLVSCGSTTYLARSTDEGTTWPILTNDATGAPLTVPADGELRVDQAGNLYLVAQLGDSLDLWVSQDAGQSWRAPQDMTAPGASGVVQWDMAEQGAGEVAVSYLAHTGSGSGYDGYLSVTQDALTSGPLFWGVSVNDPSTPLLTTSPTPARDDFIGVDIGPDGTPWASFYASCSASDTDPACAGQTGDPEAAKAVAARLAGLP
ncbi:MAG: sialidase family protein [Acidimicrobiales bacterium]